MVSSFRDAPPNSGLPEFGNIIVQVGNSRLGCAGLTPKKSWIAGTTRAQLICPSGCPATIVSSPVRKNISLPALVETPLLIPSSRPTKGRIAIVTDVRRDAVDAAVSCAQSWIAGRVSRERSAAYGRAILLRTAKSCGPDAPTLASSSWMLCRPYRARIQRWFAGDGGKQARSPGRARRNPLKPLRAGMPGDSGVLVVTRVRSTTIIAHEAAGAAGIRHSPRPRLGREINQQLGRFAPREREAMFGIGADPVIPGRCQRVRAKRGPMTGSASNPES